MCRGPKLYLTVSSLEIIRSPFRARGGGDLGRRRRPRGVDDPAQELGGETEETGDIRAKTRVALLAA